jgi:hypothetical protein
MHVYNAMTLSEFEKLSKGDLIRDKSIGLIGVIIDPGILMQSAWTNNLFPTERYHVHIWYSESNEHWTGNLFFSKNNLQVI